MFKICLGMNMCLESSHNNILSLFNFCCWYKLLFVASNYMFGDVLIIASQYFIIS